MKAKSASKAAPSATGTIRKLHGKLFTTTRSGSIPAGGWNVRVRCIPAIERPTARAAAHGSGPAILSTISPMIVATIWPPIRARGCAASTAGEPMTRTMDVANGIAMSGMAARVENASMSPIATAPPAEPANIPINAGYSFMQSHLDAAVRRSKTAFSDSRQFELQLVRGFCCTEPDRQRSRKRREDRWAILDRNRA